MSLKQSQLVKMTALLTAMFFASGIGVCPQVRASTTIAPDAKPVSSVPADLNLMTIPAEMGTVQEYYKGKGNKTVILIQDAHAIPDAQRSIQKLTDYFQREYGVSLVALEGADSQLDPQIFKSFPDQKILKKTFEKYYENGELTGTTAAAIFNDTESIYHGVEDWNLYEQGLYYFLSAMSHETRLLENVRRLEEAVQAQKKTIYSKELLDLDEMVQSFHDNRASLVAVLKVLAKYKEPPQGSEIAILLEESQISSDSPDVEREVGEMAKRIEGHLQMRPFSQESREKMKLFHEKMQAFQTSQMTAHAFALFLKELAVQDELPVSVSDKLLSLMKNERRMKDIEGMAFFKSLEQYIDSIKRDLFRNEEQVKLDQQSQRIGILRKLVKLELSREDWAQVKAIYHDLDSKFPAGLLRPHVLFYQNAVRRDGIFLKRLVELMQMNKKESVLFVAGGFHANGLIQGLKKNNMSYLLIMPQIAAVPENSRYREHMTGKLSWSHYYQVENGKLSLYKAFVRGTRDNLLSQSSQAPGPLLKQWRDQIMRDLAARGEIHRVNQYTPFIDEVMQSGNGKNELAEKLGKIDRFIDGLRRLEAAHQVNPQNILNLLKPSTMGEAFKCASLGMNTYLSADGRRFRYQNDVLTPVRFEMRSLIDELTEYSKAFEAEVVSQIPASVQKTAGQQKHFEIQNREIDQAIDMIPEGEPGPAVYLGAGSLKEVRKSQKLFTSNKFDKIILVDVREDMMRQALKEMDLDREIESESNPDGRIKLVVADLSMLNPEFVTAVEKSIRNSADPNDALVRLSNALQEWSNRQITQVELPSELKKYLRSGDAKLVLSPTVFPSLPYFIQMTFQRMIAKHFGQTLPASLDDLHYPMALYQRYLNLWSPIIWQLYEAHAEFLTNLSRREGFVYAVMHVAAMNLSSVPAQERDSLMQILEASFRDFAQVLAGMIPSMTKKQMAVIQYYLQLEEQMRQRAPIQWTAFPKPVLNYQGRGGPANFLLDRFQVVHTNVWVYDDRPDIANAHLTQSVTMRPANARFELRSAQSNDEETAESLPIEIMIPVQPNLDGLDRAPELAVWAKDLVKAGFLRIQKHLIGWGQFVPTEALIQLVGGVGVSAFQIGNRRYLVHLHKGILGDELTLSSITSGDRRENYIEGGLSIMSEITEGVTTEQMIREVLENNRLSVFSTAVIQSVFDEIAASGRQVSEEELKEQIQNAARRPSDSTREYAGRSSSHDSLTSWSPNIFDTLQLEARPGTIFSFRPLQLPEVFQQTGVSNPSPSETQRHETQLAPIVPAVSVQIPDDVIHQLAIVLQFMTGSVEEAELGNIHLAVFTGRKRILVNARIFDSEDSRSRSNFPGDVKAQIKAILSQKRPDIPSETVQALKETVINFALAGRTGNPAAEYEELLAKVADAEPLKPLEHQLPLGILYGLQSLNEWGLFGRTVDIAEAERFEKEEETRVPNLDEVLSKGLHPDNARMFAANRYSNRFPPSVETRMLGDHKTVRRAHRIILGHLARRGPLSQLELQQLTGFSEYFIEPLLREESHGFEDQPQVSLLANDIGFASVTRNGQGLYELADSDAIYALQQEALRTLREALTAAMDILADADEIVRLLRGEQFPAIGDTEGTTEVTALIPGEQAKAERRRQILEEIFDVLKRRRVLAPEATMATWLAPDSADTKAQASRTLVTIFFTLISQATSKIESVNGYEQLTSAMRQSRYGFSSETLRKLNEGITGAFGPLAHIDSATLLNYTFTNTPQALLELFVAFRQEGLAERRRALDETLASAEEEIRQQYLERKNMIDGDIPFASDLLAERASQLQGVETPQQWAQYLENNVRVPKLIVAELVKLKAEGREDVLDVVDHLQCPGVTPAVAEEAKRYLKALLQNDRAAQIASWRNIFILKETHVVGLSQYGNRELHGRKMIESAYDIERSDDAIFIQGIFGLRPSHLIGIYRLPDITEYPYPNPDIFIDYAIAQAFGDEAAAQNLRRELQILFAKIYTADRAGKIKGGAILKDYTASPMLVAGFDWRDVNMIRETVSEVLNFRAFLHLEESGQMTRDRYQAYRQSRGMFKAFSPEAEMLSRAAQPEDYEDLDMNGILDHLIYTFDTMDFDLGIELAKRRPSQHRIADESPRPEVRDTAQILIRQILEGDVAEADLIDQTSKIGRIMTVAEIIRELEVLKAEVERDAKREKLPLDPNLIQSEIQVIINALTGLKDKSYAVGYLVPANPNSLQENDFINAVGRFPTSDQVLVFGGRVSNNLRSGLANLGKIPRPLDMGSRRSLILPGQDQVYAGLVATQQSGKDLSAAESLIPVTSALDKEMDPLVSQYVIVLQTAIAVLLAHEIRDEGQKKLILLHPAELLKNYNMVPTFESQIIQASANGFQISTVAVRAYLEWKAAQRTKTAA